MGPGHLALVFTATFLVTAPFSSFCSHYGDEISAIPLISAANYVFVTRYGSLWLTTIFYGLLISAMLSGRRKNLFVNGSAKFCIQILSLLMCNWWFFGVSILERLNVATGGHCESSLTVQSVSECKEALSDWINGFDLSGHYLFLTTSCILLVHGWDLRPKSGLLTTSKFKARMVQFFQYLAVLIIIVWYMEFLVTSLFFHTALEKMAGLAAMVAISLCFKIPDRWFPVQKEIVGEYCEV